MNQIFTIIRKHWLPLLGLNSLLLAATIYVGLTSPKVWKASAQLNLPQTTGNVNASLGTLGTLSNSGVGFSDQVNPLKIQSAIITSDVVLNRVRAADPERSLYSSLGYKGLFEVASQDQTTIMILEAEGSDAALARRRVVALIKAYQERLNELRRSDVDVREQFAQEELDKSQANLTQAENALAKFQQSTGLVDSVEQTKGLVGTINQLKATQATVIAEAQSNLAQAKVMAADLGTTPQRAINSLRLAENKEYQAIREKVSQVDSALADARGKYTDESPQVQALLLQRQELVRVLGQRFAAAVPNATAAEVDTTLGGTNARDSRVDMIAELIKTQNAATGQQQQARQIQVQMAKLSAELNSISTNQVRLSDLQRKKEVAEGVNRAIIAQLQQVKTNPFNSYPNVQTLNEPTVSPKSSGPSRRLILLGGMLASFFGSTALVLFLEARKALLRPKDLQQVDFPVLVSIPRLKHPEMERELEADLEIEFHRLASVISSMMLENQRLMVTSATLGEGKTTVTLGLALALVNFGFRVLIVDGDLQQARMSQRLGHSKSANPKQIPVSVYPGLDLMPAPSMAKDKTAEFFARGSFEQRLNAIQDSGYYDYVLVDSAPVSLAIEPTLMSAVVRNVLFVVRPGTSDRHAVMDSFEQLTQQNARIMGLVVNGVESRTQGYRYGRQRELLEAEV